jgi:hypothetical protein
MRPSFFALLAALALPACSSSTPSSSAGNDASFAPNQEAGAACDPSVANACAASTSPCFVNVCTSGTCEPLLVEDAGAGCAVQQDASLPGTGAVCATSSDCDGGQVCGFYASAGCVATGVCVTAATTASGLPPAACGCNGLADPYVATDFTGAPAVSATPCANGGLDAGAPDASEDQAAPGTDAGTDATLGADADAGLPSDASPGADADAAGSSDGAAE